MAKIAELLEELTTRYASIGAAHMEKTYSRFEPASDEVLEGFESLAGCALTDDLREWMQNVSTAHMFLGNYSAVAPAHLLDSATRTKQQLDEGVFDPHLKNIRSWNDGRFNGVFQECYWNPAWIPFIRDGCGNAYCVDLAPGASGARGQLLQMEWQDGQGPYVAPFATLESLLATHVRLLDRGMFEVNDEFLEYADVYGDALTELIAG